MLDVIQFIIVLTAYIAVSCFIIWLIKRYLVHANKYFRLLTLSFVYALFLGISIALSGGHPGFAFPAPNIIALGLMVISGFYSGIIKGLIILCIWWVVFFVFMLIRLALNKKK